MDTIFLPFLVRAKRATYASSDEAGRLAGVPLSPRQAQPSSRPASHDLVYREGDLLYLDTYLGGFAFAGEEAVWRAEIPLWSMNYYGTMLGTGIPDDFGAFLKLCLRAVPPDAPYRGPERYAAGPYAYACRWEGAVDGFHGEETITLDGADIYRLYFHGGQIR